MDNEKSDLPSYSSYKYVGYLCAGSLAILGLTAHKLKKANAKTNTSVNIITPKNMLYGYIATTSALMNPIIAYTQISFITNIPSTFPNWFLNKYFPNSCDPNRSKANKFNIKTFKKRIFWFSLFAFHHSIFARHSIKKWLSDKSIMPLRIERSIYMLSANILMLYLIDNWHEKSNEEQDTIENDESEDNYIWVWKQGWCEAPWLIQYIPFITLTILGMKAANSGVAEEDFAGITDAFNVNFDEANAITMSSTGSAGDNKLCVEGYYLLVRHPQMFFNLLGFLAIPKMSVSRLTLTCLFGIYVLIGIQFEERGLIKTFGKSYIEYQKQVPQLIPTWSSLTNFISFYSKKKK
eukprot:120458_1